MPNNHSGQRYHRPVIESYLTLELRALLPFRRLSIHRSAKATPHNHRRVGLLNRFENYYFPQRFIQVAFNDFPFHIGKRPKLIKRQQNNALPTHVFLSISTTTEKNYHMVPVVSIFHFLSPFCFIFLLFYFFSPV